MIYIIYMLAGIFIGLVIGILSALIIKSSKTFGTLRTAYDGNEPYLFLDMDKYPEDIRRHKYVVFKVDQKPISHE